MFSNRAMKVLLLALVLGLVLTVGEFEASHVFSYEISSVLKG